MRLAVPVPEMVVGELPPMYLFGREGLADLVFGHALVVRSTASVRELTTFSSLTVYDEGLKLSGWLSVPLPMPPSNPARFLFLWDKMTQQYVLYGLLDEVRHESGFHTWRSIGAFERPDGRITTADLLMQTFGVDRNLDRRPDGYLGAGWLPERCSLKYARDDPDAALYNQNSNLEAELALSSEAPVGDYCDGVPVLRLVRQTVATRYRDQSAVSEDPTSALHFRGVPRFGEAAWADNFEEKVAFRYCGCIDELGMHLPRNECLEGVDGGPPLCNPGEASLWWDIRYREPRWTPIDVKLKVGSSRTTVSGDFGGAPTEFVWRSLDERPKDFVWNWFGPAASGKIPSREGDEYLETSGFLASFVIPEGPYRSRRDDWQRQKLRVSVQYHRLPLIVAEITDDSSVAIVEKVPRIDENWVDPFEKLWIWTHIFVRPKFPLDIPTVPPLPLHLTEEATGFMLHPGLVSETGLGQYFLHRGGGEAVEVTSVLSPFVKRLVAERENWATVSPVEPLRFLDFLGNRAQYVALGRKGSMAHGARVVEATSQGLQVRGEMWGGIEPMNSLNNISQGMTSDFQLNGGAAPVFSAWEQAVYVVGGAGTGSVIERIDLDLGVQENLFPSDPPNDYVLSATYDPIDRSLYYLDWDQRSGNDWIRLRAFHLEEDRTEDLWEVPYDGSFPFVSLDLSSERELILTAANDEGITVWRMDREDGSFLRRMDIAGTPLRAPFMGDEELTLPYLDESEELNYLTYERWEFVEGEACKAL